MEGRFGQKANWEKGAVSFLFCLLNRSRSFKEWHCGNNKEMGRRRKIFYPLEE
jgi:hypothetical protein